MKFYVVRHGQTDWNAEGRLQGRTDIELNSVGIKQAIMVAESLKQFNIDLIVSSPLKRTRKTAEIINEVIKCDIIYDKAIEERSFGDFEGMIRKEIKDEILNSDKINNYNMDKEYKNVESVKNLCNRIWKFLDKLKENYKDKNILLVTHGGASRAINAYFKGLNADGTMEKVGLKNCDIMIYED